MEPPTHEHEPESLHTILDRITRRFALEEQDAPFAPLSPPPPVHLPTNGHQNGKNHSLPMEKSLTTIHPEVNIKRHADFLFAPAHAKNLRKGDIRKWTTILPDGAELDSFVAIFPSSVTGTRPTTTTGKLFYALQKLYENNGEDKNGYVVYSDRHLARILGDKWQGEKSTKKYERGLDTLRWSAIKYERSFEDENGDIITIKDSFSFLDDYRRIEKRDRTTKQLYLSLNKFRFSEPIRKNLKANKTSPLFLDVILSLRGELATALYSRLDMLLACKKPFEKISRKLRGLYFDDLKLKGGNEYSKPSVLKREFEKATKELNGKPISTGILDLHIAQTADGKDWKLIFSRYPLPHILPQSKRRTYHTQSANPPEAIPFIVRDTKHALGVSINEKDGVFIRHCKEYPQEYIYQAIAEYRADTRNLSPDKQPRNRIAYYQAILRRIVEQHGYTWFTDTE